MASDQTDARRERVRSLWLTPDRQLAEILIEEGYGGTRKKTAEGRRTQLASMVKNVWNDRKALKKKWREADRATAADVHESRGEHLAVLSCLQAMGVEMLNDPKLKGTAQSAALQVVTRIVEAKGKALGVAEVVPVDPEDAKPKPKVVGVMFGTENLTPEMLKELRSQGYEV